MRLIRFVYPGVAGVAQGVAEVRKWRGGAWTRKASRHKAANPVCAVCGRMRFLETDHVIPLHQGGTDHPSNLQSLCRDCHSVKSAREAGGRADATQTH